ncbi:MAG: hypothetical protein ACRC7O_03470, partial [Fimbriiglobus sp.]
MMLSHFVRKLGALGGVARGTPGLELGGFVWHLAPGAATAFGPGGPDLTAWDAAGRVAVVKRNLQRTISRATTPTGAVVFVKLCRANTPRAWVREILRPPKARLEFENAVELAARGLPAIEPLAWAMSPGWLPGASVLITRDAGRATPL